MTTILADEDDEGDDDDDDDDDDDGNTFVEVAVAVDVYENLVISICNSHRDLLTNLSFLVQLR